MIKYFLWGCVAVMATVGYMSCSPHDREAATPVPYEPNISPDYSGIVLPPNIAPPNFSIREEGTGFRVDILCDEATPIRIKNASGHMKIPVRPWRALLRTHQGQPIHFEIAVQGKDGTWRQFKRITNTIAEHPIDSTLVYRFMKPIYNWWKDIGIYQRQLANFETSCVLKGASFGQGCVNCHSFVQNDPETMTIGLRSKTYGSHTLLAQDGQVDKIGAKWGYTAWHPFGHMATYSINKVRQFFHVGGMEVRDVVDLDSALTCYYVADGRVVSPPALADKDRLETYPTWSPDGRFLYFCSAPILWDDDTVPPKKYDEIQYDLHRIAYDPDTDQWGEVETVLAAKDTGLSILLPRISPDGRFLMFCMCPYGCFPIYQPGSDLYLMDLHTGTFQKLTINSEYSESWHSWSSNGRWIAFSSKRHGGLFTRTYFSYVDENGTAHKPFVLPQKDPTAYDSMMQTFSVPELIKSRIKVPASTLARTARSKPSVTVDLPITGATMKVETSERYPERE
ncbi:MAG: cytochrome C biosynthesis protein [Planctomycetes bacterium]|nr:cytochrome C biosynthesis protein [Planctomycetota bacterium]